MHEQELTSREFFKATLMFLNQMFLVVIPSHPIIEVVLEFGQLRIQIVYRKVADTILCCHSCVFSRSLGNRNLAIGLAYT